MVVALNIRKAWVEALPWTRRLKKTTPCDGIKWGTVALSDLYPRGGKPARGIQDRSKCKKNAEWHYKALKSSGTFYKEGNYCWRHMGQALDDYEFERFIRYVKKYPEKFPWHPDAIAILAERKVSS